MYIQPLGYFVIIRCIVPNFGIDLPRQIWQPWRSQFFFFWGAAASDPLCLSSSALHFSDYSFWVHHHVNRDDWQLLAHSMASDFSVAWQCLSKRTIVFLLRIKLQARSQFLVPTSIFWKWFDYFSLGKIFPTFVIARNRRRLIYSLCWYDFQNLAIYKKILPCRAARFSWVNIPK
jgi:hypothetical protein